MYIIERFDLFVHIFREKFMRKFTIPCYFGGVKTQYAIYIGKPKEDHHPLHFQNDLVSKKGGVIPQEIMDSLAKLRELADKNGVSFEELCAYALEAASAESGSNLNEEEYDDVHGIHEEASEQIGGERDSDKVDNEGEADEEISDKNSSE